MTGCPAENIDFFPQMKTSKKVLICLQYVDFYTSW